MIRCRRFAVVPLLALALALPGRGEEAKKLEDPVTLPAGALYEIGPSGDGVRVPLALHEGLAATDLAPPLLTDVAFGKVRAGGLLRDLRARLDADGAILIDVPLDPPLRRGTYDLKVRVRLKAKKAGIKPEQTLDLQMVQPEAQVRPPATLVVERVLGFSTCVDGQLVPLQETSGRTRLAGIEIHQVGSLAGAGQAGSPALLFHRPPPVPPEGSCEVGYRVSGGLPLGTLQGTAEIRGPQLAPVAFNFEIRSRLTKWWILIAAALGLVAGYLLRTQLQQWVTLGQARLQAVDVLKKIDDERQRRGDGDFRQRANGLRAPLDQAIELAASADALTQAATAGVNDLTQALAQLAERLATAQDEVDRLGRVLETRWRVPPELAEPLAAAPPCLAAARHALADTDAGMARSAVGEARSHLAAALPGRIDAWRVTAFDLLTVLDAPELAVPAAMLPGLQASTERVRGLLNGIGDLPPEPTLEQLEGALAGVDGARHAARLLLLEMRSWPQATLVEVDRTLLPAPLAVAAAVVALRGRAAELLRVLAAVAEAPEGRAQELGAALANLGDAWRVALLAQLGKVAAEDRAAVGEKLDRHLYAEAARETARLLRAAARPRPAKKEGRIQGDVSFAAAEGAAEPAAAAGVPGFAAFWQGILGFGFEPPAAAAPAARPRLDLTPAGLAVTRVHLERELARVKALRFVLTATGVVVLSFVIFGDKFVGTVADFAGIFFWAFGTDVTVDAFWNAAKGYKKS
jgi:hypothetical protein